VTHDLLVDRRIRLTYQAANHGYPPATLRAGRTVAGRCVWLDVLDASDIVDLDSLGIALAQKALAAQAPRANREVLS
jgi:hypothetical protein